MSIGTGGGGRKIQLCGPLHHIEHLNMLVMNYSFGSFCFAHYEPLTAPPPPLAQSKHTAAPPHTLHRVAVYGGETAMCSV